MGIRLQGSQEFEEMPHLDAHKGEGRVGRSHKVASIAEGQEVEEGETQSSEAVDRVLGDVVAVERPDILSEQKASKQIEAGRSDHLADQGVTTIGIHGPGHRKREGRRRIGRLNDPPRIGVKEIDGLNEGQVHVELEPVVVVSEKIFRDLACFFERDQLQDEDVSFVEVMLKQEPVDIDGSRSPRFQQALQVDDFSARLPIKDPLGDLLLEGRALLKKGEGCVEAPVEGPDFNAMGFEDFWGKPDRAPFRDGARTIGARARRDKGPLAPLATAVEFDSFPRLCQGS